MNKKYILIGIVILLMGILLGSIMFYGKKNLETKNNNPSENVPKTNEEKDKDDRKNEENKDKQNNVKNNVVQDINDKNYKALDKNSSQITNLYSKVTYNQSMLDNYIQEKITNDTIITLTLQQMEKQNVYEKNCDVDDELKLKDCEFVFSNDKVIEFAKKIFGPNVKFDITKYNGAGNGCGYYIYKSDIGKLISSAGTGCGFSEKIVNAINYAYQKEEKIVIIEKSLYITDGWSDGRVDYCKIYDYELSKGIYNNIHDRKKVADFEAIENVLDINLLEKYNQYVTYYAYIFEKGEGENYYYTDFAKLN